MAAPLWKRTLVRTMQAVAGRSVATWTANSIGLTGYNATNPTRKILSNSRRPGRMTANELAMSSGPMLRNYARQAERNNPTARSAVDGLSALVVGSGIDLEPDTGDKATDDLIRPLWKDWCDSCSVDGRTVFQLQSEGFRDVVVAGEGLWRLVILPERTEAGEIPLAVLPLESEWLDEMATGVTYGQGTDGMVQVGPILVDRYGRPVSYRLKNPDMSAPWAAEDVPATAIMHFFEKRRSMQSRGEPWFAPIIETLQQERDLIDAELQAAVTSSSIGLAVTSAYHAELDTEEDGDATDPAQSLRIGGVARLDPGDELESFANTRPSQGIMPFRAGLRGDTAAAMRVPQRYLDRDVRGANYSSMRADMLDSDRLLSPVREWYGHATIGRLYREVLPFLALKAGIALPRAKYRLIPDAQPYVDPYKDIQAAAMAVATGMSTFEQEIGKRGGDWRKVWEELKKEQDEAARLGIKLDLSGTNAPAPQSSLGEVAPANTPAKANDSSAYVDPELATAE
jgi:lambda family phage portal protein